LLRQIEKWGKSQKPLKIIKKLGIKGNNFWVKMIFEQKNIKTNI
jgi:hypothetical protein